MTRSALKGLRAHRGKVVSEAEFRRLWMSDLTAAEIGERLGITKSAVCCRARMRGLPLRPGGGGGNRKIDREILRAMWDANVRPRDIAALFKVTPDSVNRRAREWGFPPRDCHRWNSLTAFQFAMAASAAETRAAMRDAEMVDGPRMNVRRAA